MTRYSLDVLLFLFGTSMLFHFQAPLFILAFFSFALKADLRIYCYSLCQSIFCLCFLLGVLWCQVLYFNLEVILGFFLYMVGSIVISLIYIYLDLPNTTCCRAYLFSIVYTCILHQRLIDCQCVDLFLGSWFYSINLCLFCAITTLGLLGVFFFHLFFWSVVVLQCFHFYWTVHDWNIAIHSFFMFFSILYHRLFNIVCVLHWRTLLFVYSPCNSLHLLIPNSQSTSPPYISPWQLQVCSLFLSQFLFCR